MNYRQLGATGLRVSVIGLGTWQFGGEWGKRFDQADVDALLGRARELGINLVDTGECYGDHLAESLLGPAIAAHRDEWIIATKFGHLFHPDRADRRFPVDVRTDHWSPEEVVSQLDRSLAALHADYVDIYLFHSGPDEIYDRDELWHALNAQVEKGRIRYLGISLGASDNLHQTSRATHVGATVIEVTYNRLNRAAEREVFDACRRQNLGVVAREPLANGYLSGRYRPGSTITDAADWRSAMEESEVRDRLAAVEQIRANEVPAGTPMASWALGWCLQNPDVHSVVTGTKSVEQLESTAAAADLSRIDLVPPTTPEPGSGSRSDDQMAPCADTDRRPPDPGHE